MRHSWCGLLLLALLVPACKTGGPKAPPAGPAAPPDLLRPYEGAGRLLRGRGDARALTLKPGERLTGECDVAVRVRSVGLDKGTARFTLDTLGTPRLGGRGVKCKRVEPEIQLALTGFPTGPLTPEVTARIDELLPTPEAYLRAKGAAFEHPPGVAPSEVASQLPDADAGERRLARAVVAWPRLLLSVDPAHRDPSRHVRYQGLVEVEAVVGTDGRLYKPRVKTSLGAVHEGPVLDALSFWRFEPARRADSPVGARIPLSLVYRVY
ncbi:MAG: hypothetical protein ACM3PV_05355 [Betaproteobacteria bacterium]